MRLVQKSKDQTGIATIIDGSKRVFVPLFSKDLLKEATHIVELKDGLLLEGVYLALTVKEQLALLAKALEFKKKNGRIPRYIMDQLRTGFAESKGLRQISDICVYK